MSKELSNKQFKNAMEIAKKGFPHGYAGCAETLESLVDMFDLAQKSGERYAMVSALKSLEWRCQVWSHDLLNKAA